MKTKLLGLITIMFFLSCNSTRQLKQTSNDLMVSAAGLTFNAYYSKHEISKGLYKNYRRLYEKGMSMADKKENFNSFDVDWKGVPDRRFIFGAKSVSGVYELFVYEEGGVGLKNYCIISENEKGEGSMLKAYLFRRASDVNELQEIISKKDYRISD